MKKIKIDQRKIFKLFTLTFLFLGILTIIGIIWMDRAGKRIYGAFTEQVNHQQFRPKTGSLAIKNVNILSPDGDSIIYNQTILIEKGIIATIDSTLRLANEMTIIDGSNKYLIPGLIDAHVHLFKSPNDLLLYIANGVTEIREMIGEEDHLKWREEIENGRLGPKMFVASPRLGSFETMEGMFMEYSQGFMNIKNPAHAREMVKQFREEGYDGIKIYSQLSKENYEAISETAISLKMPVFGHIPWDATLDDIYKNGQSGIAHFEELMNALRREFKKENNLSTTLGHGDEFLVFLDQRCNDLADSLIENNITVTSTLWLTESFVSQKFELDTLLKEVELEYENPGISEWASYIPNGLGWLPEVNRYKISETLNEDELIKERKFWKTYAEACQILTRNLHSRGVKIMAGTDANLPLAVPGFSLHDELASLANAGMSYSAVLKSATSIPAAFLNSKSGKVKIGNEANLVLLNKNPLENITHTKTIDMVINQGQLYNRDLLDKILSKVKKANNDSRKIDIQQYQ